MSTDLVSELAARLPVGAVIVDSDIVAGYRRDRARDPDAGTPIAVVRCTSTAEVQSVLRWAGQRSVAVVPRGAGTGLSGGATAVDGGIILSTERMRGLTIDPSSQVAVCQPGVVNADLKRAAAEHSLWYPPDPSSFESCTIGGNAATNAGGLCCVKYGVTSDYVLGMEVVLADGTLARLGGSRLKDVAGYSLTKLFVGSEGTLGVITEVTVRLLPMPTSVSTLVASFSSMDVAAEAVIAIRTILRPSMLELMDHTSINAVEDFAAMGLDRSAHALLIVRSDAPRDASVAEIDQVVDVCTAFGAHDVFVTHDVEEGEMFVAARRAALPALERLGTLLLEDVGVAVLKLPELVRSIERIAKEQGITIAVIAHAGDGNTHPLIAFDPADLDQTARARKAFSAVMNTALELGGTITGEHGVGRLKKPWLPAYLGDDLMALTRRIKDALDPQGILNPGAII